MKRAVRRICLVGLAVGPLASAAPALSYRDWIAAAPEAGAPLALILEPASNGCVQQTQQVRPELRPFHPAAGDYEFYEVPARPSGGYLGQMILLQDTGIQPPGPLTVSLTFHPVEIEDLLPPTGRAHAAATNKAALKWHEPMGLLNAAAPLRLERFRRSWSVASLPPAERFALPFILPRAGMGGFRHGNNENLFTCLCEVRDARGTVLLRKQAVELFHSGRVYYGGGTAWVMGEPEADRYLRESAGINHSETVSELPSLMEPYAEAVALWVSADAAGKEPLTPAMVRRLLLMGIWIFGRESTVSNLAVAAGVPGPGPVLLGGLRGVTLPLGREDKGKQHLGHDQESLWDAYLGSLPGLTNPVAVLENHRDLFQSLKGRYLGWTIGMLGLFFGLACIGLPVAFWKLKGARRLALWWLIPAAAAAIACASLAGGQLLLPRLPQTDLTEYRFAVAGWPEVYCWSVNRSLTFEERTVAWNLPAGSFVLPGRYGSAPAGPEWFDESGGQLARGLAGLKRGQLFIEETAGFRDLPLPVAIAGGAVRPNALKILAPLRKVHVWDSGAWHSLGDLQAGQTALVPVGPGTNLFGLPQRIRDCFPSYTIETNPCPNCGKVHEVGAATRAVFSNTWIVAALDAGPAAAQPAMPDAQDESRAVWIIQLPLPPAAASDPPGKQSSP